MKKRNEAIDAAKGIGMILVVLFHSEILPGIWTQFHMPLFAFLSGMVYSDHNNESTEKVTKYV